jgi:hypothetical protein
MTAFTGIAQQTGAVAMLDLPKGKDCALIYPNLGLINLSI